MDPDETAAHEAMETALDEQQDMMKRLIVALSDKVGLSETVVWICDPNDAHSQRLARSGSPQNFETYDREIRKRAEANGRRALYVLALPREGAIRAARKGPPGIAEILLQQPEPNYFWCVFNADGFMLCKQVLFMRFTGPGGDA